MSEAIDLEAIKARCDAATGGPWKMEWHKRVAAMLTMAPT